MDISPFLANLIDSSYGPPFDLVRAGAALLSYPVAERLEQRVVIGTAPIAEVDRVSPATDPVGDRALMARHC